MLYWTEKEILHSYKMCEDKRDQPQILAELNACSLKEILDVLRRNGIDVASARHRYQKDDIREDDGIPGVYRYKYSQAELEYLRRISSGKNVSEITSMFNKKFNVSLSVDRIRTCLANHKIDYVKLRSKK